MYYLIFLLVSILLAIPTYGVSLIIFFVLKDWVDKKAANLILNSALTSLRTGEVQFLYHVNQGAIKKVFDAFSITTCSTEYIEDEMATSFTAHIKHPGYKGVMILNVMYTPRSGTKNTIMINAENA